MLLEGIFWNSSARIELNKDLDPSKRKETPYVLAGNVTE
jgi:hypothetical protein